MEFKTAKGGPPSSFISHWSSWPSFWLFPALPGTASNQLKKVFCHCSRCRTCGLFFARFRLQCIGCFQHPLSCCCACCLTCGLRVARLRLQRHFGWSKCSFAVPVIGLAGCSLRSFDSHCFDSSSTICFFCSACCLTVTLFFTVPVVGPAGCFLRAFVFHTLDSSRIRCLRCLFVVPVVGLAGCTMRAFVYKA